MRSPLRRPPVLTPSSAAVPIEPISVLDAAASHKTCRAAIPTICLAPKGGRRGQRRLPLQTAQSVPTSA